MGLPIRPQATAKGSEDAREWPGALANGHPRMQTSRSARGLPASATAWIRQPLHARERTRRWCPQGLMGHSRIDTTQLYTDEIELDELAAALDDAAARRHAQASPDLTTLEAELTDELETLRWRRRESNPRKLSIATEARRLARHRRRTVARLSNGSVSARSLTSGFASPCGSCSRRSLASSTACALRKFEPTVAFWRKGDINTRVAFSYVCCVSCFSDTERVDAADHHHEPVPACGGCRL
jgi:hypothetical protein